MLASDFEMCALAPMALTIGAWDPHNTTALNTWNDTNINDRFTIPLPIGAGSGGGGGGLCYRAIPIDVSEVRIFVFKLVIRMRCLFDSLKTAQGLIFHCRA